MQGQTRYVYVSLTTYGQTGRLVSKPGYDIIAQAMSGIMSVTGEADGAPQKSGIPLGDMVGALNMFASTMTALYHWKDTGEGQYVDVSLLRSLLYMNTPLIHCNLGKERMSKRQGNHHLLCVHMAYSTARTVISLWQLPESVSGTAYVT